MFSPTNIQKNTRSVVFLRQFVANNTFYLVYLLTKKGNSYFLYDNITVKIRMRSTYFDFDYETENYRLAQHSAEILTNFDIER